MNNSGDCFAAFASDSLVLFRPQNTMARSTPPVTHDLLSHLNVVEVHVCIHESKALEWPFGMWLNSGFCCILFLGPPMLS